jgi:hypothetical protein
MLLICTILKIFDMDNIVSFDLTKYQELKNQYDNAVETGCLSFWFEGREYLTSYCKYLLEYLKIKFKN